MKHERTIKRIGFVILAALLVLMGFCFWVAQRIERGDAPAFLSDKAAAVVAIICNAIFYAAVALGVFIVIRAFCLGLTQPGSRPQPGKGGNPKAVPPEDPGLA